ncbi:unnamed protein product [Kuraishia capsulata CBS 1993]|uniref:Uncharacterized protein n=1 Tax=Kuraishia capsulata CBS 1993 TaxID=1382522 RepID=W6MPV5_9ASCO|nr:uncharacterized protein KUCA_T00004739001 [Kuraishia capsulata CBS 1993]CDK28754.1 unnamed protein product [Kuraishia capsulata CBS 1993]
MFVAFKFMLASIIMGMPIKLNRELLLELNSEERRDYRECILKILKYNNIAIERYTERTNNE